MPTAAEHEAKYRANRGYLSTHAAADPCWAATVAFYSAVHLVEWLAARDGLDHRRHTGFHSRNNYLRTHPYHSAVFAEFMFLYDASLAARYDSLPDFAALYPGDTVREQLIDNCLVVIEAYVSTVIGSGAT